jgi:mannose-1-phosphate guanylyltransferase / mannose-6-phosphate isomerase
LLAAGEALWNSGVFLFTARSIMVESQLHAPDLVEPVTSAVAGAAAGGAFVWLEREAWRRATSISIDHAVMERSSKVWTMPYDGRWSDLGSWGAVRQELQADADGNVCSPEALAIDCRDSLLRSDAEGLTVVGLGLSNVMAVAMQDAVLVADLSHAQHVGRAVEVLRGRQVRQGDALPLDHRPWGWFETLGGGADFHVKKIVVKPGESLSLQSHERRAEHWIVVRGSAVVTLDDEISTLGVNQSVYIPAGSRHRLQNPGETPLMLVEVQTGSYFGEDDIVRHEDRYARG